MAHIGVIKALEENGIFPVVISGTSAGAIVGAMYAAGKSTEEMIEFVRRNDFLRAFKLALPFDGLSTLDNLNKILRQFLGLETFEELRKPLFIAVTNVLTGEPEIFFTGKLLDVVVASSSIPLVFKPVEINSQLYLDGGIMLNMPVEPIVPFSDFVIGVNVRPRVPIDKMKMQNIVDIAQRVFDLSLAGNMRPNETLCDVVISPRELHHFTIFQFGKWRELIEIGYEAGLEAIPSIQKALSAAETD